MNEPRRKFSTSLPLAMLTLVTGIAAAGGEAIRLSAPVEQTTDAEIFGAPLDASAVAVELADIARNGERYVGETVRVSANIAQVCQKKGCFFIAQHEDAVVRVSFKDYAFFVPTDISGRHVTFTGNVIARDITPEQAAHYAKDLGEAEVAAGPGKTFEIVANAVRVPRG